MCVTRLGRAMLRPIFDQKSRRNGQVGSELRRALEWWMEVLRLGLSERRNWGQSQARPVHLFCDASGSPAHLGAVLWVDGAWFWTHLAPEEATMEMFKRRKDQQIMGLELLAISLGLCTFQPHLSGRKVVVHCDNTGSEVAGLIVAGCVGPASLIS